MSKLSCAEESAIIAQHLEMLDIIDFGNISKKEKKRHLSTFKLIDRFLKKYASKAVKNRAKNPLRLIEDEKFREHNRILENSAVFLTDYYFVYQSGKKSFAAANYARIGSDLHNPHCLLALSYMYSKGKCGIFPNAKKARQLIELAVNYGGMDDDNFELAKDAVLESEETVQGYKYAANMDYCNAESTVLGTLMGFSDWLGGYLSRQNEQQSSIKGDVVLEKTIAGDQYIFYGKDDPGRTCGQRLKVYDPLSGKGETEDGGKIIKK